MENANQHQHPEAVAAAAEAAAGVVEGQAAAPEMDVEAPALNALPRWSPNDVGDDLDNEDVFESPATWEFFTNPQSRKIGFRQDGNNLLNKKKLIYGRHYFSPALNAYALCFGQKKKEGHRNIQFSVFESYKVESFIEKILNQIGSHPLPGRSFSSLIPFYDDKPFGYDTGNTDQIGFWSCSDIDLASGRARLIRNKANGEYQLVFNSIVSPDVVKRFKGWPGPTMYFGQFAMADLLKYIREIKSEIDVARHGAVWPVFRE